METTIALVQTISLAAAAAGLVIIGISLRDLTSHFRRNGLQVIVSQLMTTSRGGTGRLTSSKAGYAVYMWTNGKWVLETDFSQPGHEATGPSMPGSYEGQLVKREAVAI